MSVGFDVLKPYKSLILAQTEGENGDEMLVGPVIADFVRLLGFGTNPDLQIVTESPARSFEISRPEALEPDLLHVKFLHYTEKRAPGWYAGPGEVQDTLNHLIVACQLQRQVAIYLSDSRRRAAATREIRAGESQGLGALRLLRAGRLNAAFVKGEARTLWLSGIHTRVSVKPDSKILTGLNLRDALDPLADQSYHFTAARSSVPELSLPVGVSPRGSRVWVGATSNWTDFVWTVARLLRHVAATTGQERKPLPVLAIPASEAPKLAEACEIHFLPPELLADDPDLDPETREEMERWAYRADLRIDGTMDDTLTATVLMDGVALGTLKVFLDASNPDNVRIHTDVCPDAGCPDEQKQYQKELREVAHRTHWLKIWYESGHTLTDRAIFEIRHRDQPFGEFHWVDFMGYDVKTEKFWSGPFPSNALELIGGQGSLFCWVKKHWPPPGPPYSGGGGWLACDDGAMEIADFIHLDTGNAVPILTLIHVKGAKSVVPTRDISVSAYEVVVGQAVKNVRYLDRLHLDAGLRLGLEKMIGELVWYDREPSTREAMLDAIAGVGSSYRRMVVVLQPHVRKARLDAVRKAMSQGQEDRDAGRMRQLDTLLLGAQASCWGLGATFWVVADQS